MSSLSFSIVINTYDRAASLAVTLDSLRFLKHPRFEVVVVNGPSPDSTQALLDQWADRVKVGSCPITNLSVSRNIGIAMAEGDIVAFIDDDAVPEPEWLDDLEAGYTSENVGAVGGMVFNHTGYDFQAKYILCNRLGDARLDFETNPSDQYNFPGSNWYCSMLGTNASFRRAVLHEIGGFDEEYEYYLDETDVCLRVVDAGYQVRFVDRAFIHHKYLPSHIRNEKRALKNRYPVIKNKFYFTHKHAFLNHPAQEIGANLADFRARQAADSLWCSQNGHATAGDHETFLHDCDRAAAVGTEHAHFNVPQVLTPAKLARHAAPFKRHPAPFDRTKKSCLCFLSQDYPPRLSGGIARFTADLATGLAERGNDVHVLTRGEGRSTVDYENGVWVHRIVPAAAARTEEADRLRIPAHIWDYSVAMLRELERIDDHRKVDLVEAPIWDAEGIAVLLDGRFRLVTSLQTTLKIALDSHPEWLRDAPFMRDFVEPMLAIEKRLLESSHGIHAISADIAKSVRTLYGADLPAGRTRVVPLGMRPRASKPAKMPGKVNLLFVGRLEKRKGIEALLAAVPRLLDRHPDLAVTIAGDDTIPNERGMAYKDEFLRAHSGMPFLDRVRFEGKVDDDRLFGLYAGCDVFTSPSTYESFGLIFLEAMMFGKPVVGCRSGGMPEIIEDGASGLLAEPGDADSLFACLDRLVGDAPLRRTFGERALEIYRTRFTVDATAAETESFLRRLGAMP